MIRYIYKENILKVSIITVTYNCAFTLKDTIDSVLSQSYRDIEYLIIDGGSSDHTLDVIKQCEPLFDGRLHWISEKDAGIYDAMNKGISRATGDIVGFLNSDDYFTSDDVVERIVEHFTGGIAAVYGDVHFIRDGNPDKCIRYYSSKHFSKRWLRFGFMPAHPSFYCLKSVYERGGLYKTDYKIGSDFEMMVRLFYKHHLEAKYVPLDFVTMRVGGVSTRNFRSRLTLIHDDVRGCRENGVYTNCFMVCLKFLYKIFEIRCF